MPLWLWWDTPANATSFLGRRGCCGLLLFSTETHKVGDLGTFSTDKHCSTCPGSPCERSGTPTSSMADWSTSRLGLDMLLWQPQHMSLSASFCPHSAACRNILWRMTDQWGAPNSHLGYSSSNSSASNLHSASLIESPISLAHSLVVWDFLILLP